MSIVNPVEELKISFRLDKKHIGDFKAAFQRQVTKVYVDQIRFIAESGRGWFINIFGDKKKRENNSSSKTSCRYRKTK